MEYIDIFKTAGQNKSFLKVLFTHRHMQVAVANIKPGEETGIEMWNADTVLLILLGHGYVSVDGEEKNIKAGDYVRVPAYKNYEVVNLAAEPLKMVVFFSAAVLRDGAEEGNKTSEIMDPYKIRPSNELL